MSLINDALKRAKQAQRQETSSGPHLRPVESAPPPGHRIGLLLPAAMGLVALLIVLLLWELSKRGDSARPVSVRAQTSASEQTTENGSEGLHLAARPPTISSSATASVAQNPAVQVATNGNNPSPVTNTASPTSTNNSDSPGQLPRATQAASNPGATNGFAPVAAPPKPAPLRLQGIVFDPKRPSAVINGRTFFVGDKVRECRIVTITAETVTLVSAGKTNVLSMAE